MALLRTERVQGDVVALSLEPGVPQVGLDILAAGYPWPEQSAAELIEKESRVNVNVTVTFRALHGIIASRIPTTLQFEIDKFVNPGQSGGPVVSIESGKLVGMCQGFRYFKINENVIPMHLSYCLSSDAIRGKLTELGVTIN
jgi:hypothetical protein